MKQVHQPSRKYTVPIFGTFAMLISSQLKLLLFSISRDVVWINLDVPSLTMAIIGVVIKVVRHQ